MEGISPPLLEPAMPLEGQAENAVNKPRREKKRRKSIFGLRRKPGNIIRLPTDPVKKRFRRRSVFYTFVPDYPPEKHEEHEQPLQGDTSINAEGEPILSETEIQQSPDNRTSPVVIPRSSRVIKTPKRFDEIISWPRRSKLKEESQGEQEEEYEYEYEYQYEYLADPEIKSEFKGDNQQPSSNKSTGSKTSISVKSSKLSVEDIAEDPRDSGSWTKMTGRPELPSKRRRRRRKQKLWGRATAAGMVSTETWQQAVNNAGNIEREDGGGDGMMMDVGNIKREDVSGDEGMMVNVENIKRENVSGDEGMMVNVENIKREYVSGGEGMMVDAGYGYNIKHVGGGEVVMDAENVQREDGGGGEGMVAVMVEQGDISRRVNISNKHMLHLLKRAKVPLIKIDQQKHKLLKLSQTDTLFTCYVCDRTFPSSKELTQHEDSHSQEDKPYRCPYCRASFWTFTELTVHRRHLCKARQCICKDCSMVFRSPTQLRTHRLSLHPQPLGEADDETKTHRCGKCSRGFKTQAELMKHQENFAGDQHCNEFAFEVEVEVY